MVPTRTLTTLVQGLRIERIVSVAEVFSPERGTCFAPHKGRLAQYEERRAKIDDVCIPIRDAFARLGPSATEAELSQLIAEQYTAPISSEVEQLIAEAGTIVVMDHALHHGMAPNESETVRRAVYYRLPWLATNRPCDVLNPDRYRAA